MAATKPNISEKNKMATIHAVTVAVAQSIELDVVLKTALDKVMEAFNAGSGAIYLVDFNTGRLSLKIHQGLTPAFVAEKSDVPPGTGCAGWAVDHGRIFAAFGRPEAEYICEDAERLMGIDCLLASPFGTKRRIHGVIELFAPISRRLTEDEASLIKIISDQIGIAIENARLYEESRENVLKLMDLQKELAAKNKQLKAHLSQELHIAEMLQKSLLPRKLPRVPGVQIAARLISATEAADVGGDFYDFIRLDENRLAIIVGDVCGSGIEAATMTSMAQNTIRAFAWEGADVVSILERTNRVLYVQTDPAKFVAMFLGLLDLTHNKLEYCVAGQPLPIVVRADGRLTSLSPGCIALGVDPDAQYVGELIDLQKGDTLLIFTDGLIEARHGHALFGEDSVKKILKSRSGLPLDELVDELLASAKTFGGGTLRDDVALVSLRLR